MYNSYKNGSERSVIMKMVSNVRQIRFQYSCQNIVQLLISCASSHWYTSVVIHIHVQQQANGKAKTFYLWKQMLWLCCQSQSQQWMLLWYQILKAKFTSKHLNTSLLANSLHLLREVQKKSSLKRSPSALFEQSCQSLIVH